jgi:hypothetical protein
MEEWKTVPGTNDKIEVSNMGRVRSWLRGDGRILKTQKDSKGYHRLRVTIDRQKMSFKLHRIVAGAFIDNPDNLPQVNHIDGNKDNNVVSNLEWVSNRDNAHHAIANGLWDSVIAGSRKENARRMKRIIATKDDAILEFESIREAEKYFGSRHIVDVLKGRRQACKGYHFQYAKGGDANDYHDDRTAE